jgi:formylglycine-generating enzyme required for sulfatase activity
VGGLADARLRAMMSMRADFFGELLKDEPLYAKHLQINVPPLREEQLREVVSRPAALLSARFETADLAPLIAHRTAEESTTDAGALPLLSYLLDDMWTKMVRQGDGVLRLPVQALELGGVLVDRADAFLSAHSKSEDELRRIFTLKLAMVREGEEPTRRRAPRAEFTDEEWRLVTELANHPNRLLVTATSEAGDTYTEVAHEAVFRSWGKLREWLGAERNFLAWRSGLEFARREWQATPVRARKDALLRGFALGQARGWLTKRPEDISEPDRAFIMRSRRQQLWRQLRVHAIAAAVAVALGSWWQWPWLKERSYWLLYVHPLTAAQENALAPLDDFIECVDCPKMVVVPSGSITMGSLDSPDEQPPHPVAIERPFAVSMYELTFEQWDACVSHGDCAANISDDGWGRGQQPAINVSWKEAKQYLEWLHRITGKEYRLLTEAEWEYAARAAPLGGRSTHFSFGNDDAELGQYAWFGLDQEPQPHPVGQKKPNRLRLYDMHGNVSEWVEDCYRDNYRDAAADGSAWTAGNCNRRIIRGGSWMQRARMLRSAARDWGNFDKGSNTIGIRVGRSIAP